MTINTIMRGLDDSCSRPRNTAWLQFGLRWFRPHMLRNACRTLAAKRRTRRVLAQLGDEHLLDIGVTRDQAMREAERILWRGDWYG